jgi:hypothetical protein
MYFHVMSRLAGWVLGLSAAIAVLAAAGTGPLAGPDLGNPSSWATWAAQRDALDAGVAVARTVLLLVAVYLLAVTLLALVARLARRPRLLARCQSAGGPLVRRIVGGALGAGLTVSTFAPVAAAAAVDRPPVMRRLEGPTTTATPTPLAPPPLPSPPQPPPPAPADVHVVQPGDSFWRIARDRVAASLGREPTDREVARYWRVLVEANRNLLVGPDPDLIFPGQRFRLP